MLTLLILRSLSFLTDRGLPSVDNAHRKPSTCCKSTKKRCCHAVSKFTSYVKYLCPNVETVLKVEEYNNLLWFSPYACIRLFILVSYTYACLS